MKACIVNCFDTNEVRVDLIHNFLKRKGYTVTVIQSNFRHIKKEHRVDKKEDFIFIKSKPYYKNLSVGRIASHYKFASDAFKVVKKLQPNLLYVIVPPNSLAKFAAKYKRMNIEVRLIFDLMDLWPETMPIDKVKSFPPFTFWGAMRDKSLKFADLVITECNLYQTVLSDTLKGIKTETVYLANKDIEVSSNLNLNDDEVHLAYLGSINNIIDISKIKEIIEVINKIKPVTLHIIGDGENKEELVHEVESTGALVEYHGKIYDPQKKQDIFDKCNFGLNIMKDSVCVGLTMKSIDYFQRGIPIINNIPADTAQIVEKYGVGVNIINDIDLMSTFLEIINLDKKFILKQRKSTLSLYKEQFSIEANNRQYELVFKEFN